MKIKRSVSRAKAKCKCGSLRRIGGMRIRIADEESGYGQSEKFRFGSVVVEALKPTPAELNRNIKAGQRALGRAGNALVKRGVKIQAGKGVPLFYADPKNPGFLVRELDGKRERGRFVGGEFTTDS